MNIFEAEKLYFLGPEGTYAQQAMMQFVSTYNIKVETKIPKTPITAILKAVDADKNAIAVLPIENSIEGIVRETIDNLVKLKDDKLKIVAETIIPISHCLMSKSESIDKIRHVISHPQALGQCSGYLCENLPNANISESSSTSEAAKTVATKSDDCAAIASEVAADIFGLNILARRINDEKDNKTRFILLARNPLPKTNSDKTSIFFAIKNESGSLANVLNVLKEHNINLLYIDSRPSRKKMGEYNFCVDLEGNFSEPNIQSALNAVQKYTNKLVITGSYPKFE